MIVEEGLLISRQKEQRLTEGGGGQIKKGQMYSEHAEIQGTWKLAGYGRGAGRNYVVKYHTEALPLTRLVNTTAF